MSEAYRDDVTDTLVVFDETWLRLHSIVEDTLVTGDFVHHKTRILLQDSFVVGDEVNSKQSLLTIDALRATDEVLGSVSKRNIVVDGIKVSDTPMLRANLAAEDTLTIADQLLPMRLRAITTDSIRVDDSLHGQRHTTQLVQDTLRVSDLQLRLHSELIEDGLAIFDSIHGHQRARDLVQDSLRTTEHALAGNASREVVQDTLRIADELFGRLKAKQIVQDTLLLDDEPLHGSMLLGQAWTCDTDGWAMSRYAPFAFTGLAVLNGKVYATAPDGVYALDGDAEEINAELRTGLVSVAKGAMAITPESRIEYTLNGTAALEVTTVQAGNQSLTYSYPLRARPQANVLTNARFELGRGLRGTHFAYRLRLHGTQAHINDWNLQVFAGQRSL